MVSYEEIEGRTRRHPLPNGTEKSHFQSTESHQAAEETCISRCRLDLLRKAQHI